MQEKKIKKAVIIPTYNERQNIEVIIPIIFNLLPDVQIFVVDDNSPDGTGIFVAFLQKKFSNLHLIKRQKKEGLGKAYIHAFRHIMGAGGAQTIVMMDADMSHDPKYLPKIFEMSLENDVVVGSRYIKGGQTEGWESWRKILSYGGNFYCKLCIVLSFF